MLLKKFITKSLYYQLIRIPIFSFIVFFFYYVFKTRSIDIVYLFTLALGIIFIYTFFKMLYCAITFSYTIKKEDKLSIEEEFLSSAPYCDKYYILKEYFIIFDVSLTESYLRLIPFSAITAVTKSKASRSERMIITLELSTKANTYLDLVILTPDATSKASFNTFYTALKNKQK